jgi:hypothetical protein
MWGLFRRQSMSERLLIRWHKECRRERPTLVAGLELPLPRSGVSVISAAVSAAARGRQTKQ